MLQEEQQAKLISSSPLGDMRFKLTHKRFVVHRIAIKLWYYTTGLGKKRSPTSG